MRRANTRKMSQPTWFSICTVCEVELGYQHCAKSEKKTICFLFPGSVPFLMKIKRNLNRVAHKHLNILLFPKWFSFANYLFLPQWCVCHWQSSILFIKFSKFHLKIGKITKPIEKFDPLLLNPIYYRTEQKTIEVGCSKTWLPVWIHYSIRLNHMFWFKKTTYNWFYSAVKELMLWITVKK